MIGIIQSTSIRMDAPGCKICNIGYDEDGHRPRIAPCGHGLCTACIRALIHDSTFECPQCREKHNADSPEDLQINYDLIDVIRAFKTKNSTILKETSSVSYGAANTDACNIHCKAISHWCIECHMWICDDCLEFHSTSMGCSTANSTKAMDIMKKKNIENIDTLLTIFDEDSNYVSSKLQEHTKLAEKHAEEAKKLRNSLEQGKSHKEKLVESKTVLMSANTPNAISDRIKLVAQRKLILRVWSIKNLGTDAPLGLTKALKEGKYVYSQMIIKTEKKHAKLKHHEEGIYLHSFWNQSVEGGSIIMPFDDIQKLIPKEPSLIFLELSLGGVIKGRILIRLDKSLPNIRDHVVQAVTGQRGPSLKGITFNHRDSDWLKTEDLPFNDMKVTRDSGGRSNANRDEVIVRFANGYLENIYFIPPKPYNFGSKCCVFGKVEDGMDIVQMCYDNYKSGQVKISDCGLVIEQE